MDCPTCQATVPERSKFCSECGTLLPRPCPACGHLTPASAKFCPECGASLSGYAARPGSADAGAGGAREPASPPVTAERRQVTVMFCDLVGSTTLATRLDPEDLREIVNAYHRCVADTVARFHGFVARTMGDGVMAYFGYPQAREDDVERAVRAGLALVEAVAGLDAPERLQVRVGLDTGRVVVGELMQAGEASERGILGETPNRAARLQAIAEPNTVLVGPGARPLLGDLFEYRDLGSLELKGFAEPINAYRVLGPSMIESRFEALHATTLAPLIGREEEIELLERRWQRTKAGAGQVVLISGEPGIGKSRLTSAMLDQIASEPHSRLRYFCSPHHMHSALYPMIRELERAAGFARDDSARAKLAKLAAILPHTSPSSEDVWLLAEMLSVPDAGQRPELGGSPEQRKQKTLQALIRRIEALSQERPVLMVLEDVQWIDPTSLEVMDRFVQRARQLSVLVIMTFRPEFSPPWVGQPHVTMRTLSRLDQHEGAALIDRIAGERRLPPDVVSEILDRTDGVPLFIEELTKAVVEARAAVSRPPPGTGAGLAIPATLDALLMARFDRLDPTAKEVAQIGAAIGREFSYELLAAVGRISDRDLSSALRQLVRTGLLSSWGEPPEATYLFKHALVQDASYRTMLRSRRRELHARIVAVLEARYPAVVEQQPDLVAHHCTQADLVEKAIAYWNDAGQKSLARSANTEAAAQLRKGLHLLATLPESRERRHHELGLQSTLAAALVASQGNAAPETGESYARARELCEQLGETAALIPVLSGLSTYHQTRAEYAAMREVAEDLLRRGTEQDNIASAMVGHRSMGICLHQLGEFAAAREHFEHVLRLYSAEQHHGLASIAAYDMRAVALSYLGWDLFLLGQPDEARALSNEALAWSRQLRHPHTVAFALVYAALVNLLRRDHRSAEERLNELTAFAAEHRFPVWLALAHVMHGYVLGTRGDAAAGLELARKGWANATATGLRWNRPFYLALLAAACERGGQADEGFDLLGAALDAVEETGERWFQAELHRHRGEWLARRGKHDEAHACFERALAVARRQHARIWELQAASSLARLSCERGQHGEAQDVLGSVLATFSEGYELPALRDARGLLDSVLQRGLGIA
jgi:class 3 adenylate cyclase/predicted ATPase